MTEKHDITVAGGGHNGLTLAAYLARAGLDVCVIEQIAPESFRLIFDWQG